MRNVKKKNFYFVKFLKGGSASLDDWIRNYTFSHIYLNP